MAVHPKMVPQVLPEPLIGPVGQVEYLVQEEGEHVEKEEIAGEIAYAMPVVMRNRVAVVLDGTEDLVFNHPPASTDTDYFFYRLIVERQIGPSYYGRPSFIQYSK
jgi:hypothetical protein